LKQKDSDIHALLLSGVYQLRYLDTPPHAAINETVAATVALKKDWAKGLVNAVLRNVQRQGDELTQSLNEWQRAAHPQWLYGKLQKNYPPDIASIIAANNDKGPLTLRVNARKTSREDYLQQLNDAGIAAQVCADTASGIRLDTATDVTALPGWNEGVVSVQDASAQLAGELLPLASHQRVLDACAAPGGKTAHLLEREPSLQLTAIDIDAKRLMRVKETLARLQLPAAECIDADVGIIDEWWNGKMFDRILLDAPCSATGVIRRHPDIKLLRTPKDIEKLAIVQLRLLTQLWETLADDGYLLYATCSVLPQENSAVIAAFLKERADAEEVEIDERHGMKQLHGRQRLPEVNGGDGFYYALLRKRS
jgi:16S rRNA (cytosine967-C5)-methyltransferase